MIIPFRGKVQCTDKPGGHTNGVVVERVTGRVTHIIVREPGMLGTERVVPIENVVDSDADTVHLDMVLIQLNAMPAFKVSDEYRSISPQKTYGSAGQGASQQFMSSVEGMPANEQYLDMGASSMGRTRENIDENEVAVDQDVKVQATDGEIGKASELIINDDKVATHFVMRTKGLLSHHDVTIPLTAIDHVSGGVVHLNIDKQQVNALPRS